MNKAFKMLLQANPIAKVLFTIMLLALMTILGVKRVLALPDIFYFLGNSFNVTPNTNGSNQMAPSIAYNSNLDQWLIVWQDDRLGAQTGIYGRRVDKNASLLNPEITVIDSSNIFTQPSVAFDSTQFRYLVVWEDTSNGNIEGRILNANGSNYSVAFLIADCTDCSFPDVVYSPQYDEYLVVWEENLGISDKDVHGRLVGVGGTPDPGGAFDIANVVNIIEQSPAVVVDPSDGKYLVVFSAKPDLSLNIYGQRLFSTGAKSGGILGITSESGDELSPDVAFNPVDDSAFVAWHHDVAVGTTEVKGRLLQANNSVGGQTTLSTSGGFDEQNVSLAYASIGDPYLATWDGQAEVYELSLTATGAAASAIVNVTSSASTQYGSSVVFGADRFLVAFNDYNGQYDIFGRFGTANLRSLFLPIVQN